jgi:predicted phosphodiesterase
MRILVISDIHANLAALKAVLADAGDFDAVWCLGDLVGYGPDPNDCIALVCELPNLICLLGNHDAAVIDRIEISAFNPEARQVILWTQSVLLPENHAYLAGLPEKAVEGQVTLAHGSPRQPVWEYLLDARSATQNFNYFETSYCFVGHSHLPVIFQLRNGGYTAKINVPKPGNILTMAPRAIFNPGSVGQPRDRDPRAAYALFDPDERTWEYRRVDYDVTSVQNRMLEAQLPPRHITRLSNGM